MRGKNLVVVLWGSLLLGALTGVTSLVQAAPSPVISAAVQSSSRVSAASSCTPYYFHRAPLVNVGGDGNQLIANTTPPTSTTPEIIQAKLNQDVEIARFYSNPALSTPILVAGNITGVLWLKSTKANAVLQVNLFDYNPAAPAGANKTFLGTTTFTVLQSDSESDISFNIAPALATIPMGHRLLFVVSGQRRSPAPDVEFSYDSNGRASSYTLCTETTLSLAINKRGPDEVTSGEPIGYTLTVTNTGAGTVQGLTVTDVIPDGANYVSGGSRDESIVTWTASLLSQGSSLNFTFTVTAATLFPSTITNRDYRVVANGNVSALGQTPVVTTVKPDPNQEPGAIHRFFLPLLSRQPVQLTQLVIKSVNTGGINPLQVLNPDSGELLLTCNIGNNVTRVCGSFPAIAKYKIVAFTAKCGKLQGIFSDAASGGTVTREIFCN